MRDCTTQCLAMPVATAQRQRHPCPRKHWRLWRHRTVWIAKQHGGVVNDLSKFFFLSCEESKSPVALWLRWLKVLQGSSQSKM
jgi:hypothetical protein